MRAFLEGARQAQADVRTAARVLRLYAAKVSDPDEKLVLENAATSIEWDPSVASGDRLHDGFDWDLMRQGLSERAFQIDTSTDTFLLAL